MDDSDDENYGATSVWLGYAAKEVTRSELTALDNHLGGSPIWPAGVAPSSDLLQCKVCSGPLQLLGQINAPIDGKVYDRFLFVFTCLRAKCRRKEGSVRAIRAIHKSEEVAKRIQAELSESGLDDKLVESNDAKLGDLLFSSGAPAQNPFASPAGPSKPPVVSKEPPKGPRKSQQKNQLSQSVSGDTESDRSMFPYRQLDVEEEFLTPEKGDLPKNVQITEMATEEDGEEPMGGPDAELSAIAASVSDPVFAHFLSITSNNPDQVLRYDLPLDIVPYAEDKLLEILKTPSKIPSSPLDGSRRRFELQLVPQLISELESDEMLLEGMEWGTIVVATPENDVLPPLGDHGVGYAEEWVGVQWESLDPPIA